MQNKLQEIWKPVVGSEGSYEVSNLGRVRCCKILKQHKNSSKKQNYYLQVSIKGVHHYVHRLVAKAFLEKKIDKTFVNHRDGNKTNNHLKNLEWVTPRENVEHASKNNLMLYGEQINNAKIKNKQAIEIIQSNKKSKELAKIYNVTITTINNIKRGTTFGKVTLVKLTK